MLLKILTSCLDSKAEYFLGKI